ncbi:hypothetical protein BJ912DRAFT_500704 [Pholiota molesta]|nr:hypothetical protein BJ912DRAFT_500704 [Pholiota molesta]
MSSDHTPRMSIEPSRHGSIDAELKSLKFLSRRLQANLTLLATELQLLQRLYYKNKNQHRGALFWRNIAEVRRYIERVANLNLQDSLAALRYTFYGSTETSRSMKGPWTHFPNQKYLTHQGNQYKTAIQLMEKMSEICLRAYKSFHRSLQSAAFLQILLMFVAISSRTRAISMELQEILAKTYSSVTNLLAIISTPTSQQINDSVSKFTLPLETSKDADMSAPEAPTLAPHSLPVKLVQTSAVSVVIERTASKKARKDTEQTQKISDSLPVPRKKKRKVTDEIDEIFGL